MLYALNCPGCGAEWSGRAENEPCPICRRLAAEYVGVIDAATTETLLARPYWTLQDRAAPGDYPNWWVGVTPADGIWPIEVVEGWQAHLSAAIAAYDRAMETNVPAATGTPG